MSDSVSRRALLKNIAVFAGTAAAATAVNAYATTAAPAAKPGAKPAPKPVPKAASAAAAAPAVPGALPHLEETDPAAKALGYVADAKRADPKSVPARAAGAQCSNCLQLQGKTGDEWRPCNMYPKKLVHQAGWCKVYSKKVGAA